MFPASIPVRGCAVFDVNHDNFLELGELIRAHDTLKTVDTLPPQLQPVGFPGDQDQQLRKQQGS